MPNPLAVDKLRTNSRELNLEAGQKVYHLPDWHNLSHPERLTVIRQIAMQRGRDPRIARFVTKILKKNNIKPRDYVGQAKTLLKWVQNPKNMYYVNEPGERLQDPIYTIKAGHGDCDDLILLLGAFYESIGLPWKLVLSGRHGATGKKIRYIEGSPIPENCSWVHIYGMVGDRPFSPTKWYFVEPTVHNVPFGWDVIDGDARYLPEMAKKKTNRAPYYVKVGKPPAGHKRGKLPPLQNRSPAYSIGYGSVTNYGTSSPPPIASAVGASVAEFVTREEQQQWINWKELTVSIVTGVLVSVGSTILLDMVQGTGKWEKGGSIFNRFNDKITSLSDKSVLSLPSPLTGSKS